MASKNDLPPHGFLPSSNRVLRDWLNLICENIYGTVDHKQAEASEKERWKDDDFVPAVRALEDLIDTDPRANMWFHQMFTQMPQKLKDDMFCKNYKMLLRAMNHFLVTPPVYTEHHVGCPINGMLTWPMGTVAGHAAFLSDQVNARLKEVLVAWKFFLQSPDSRGNLTTSKDGGWFQPKAIEKMAVYDDAGKKQTFTEMYVCDPKVEFWGFKSWDDFFVRSFRKGMRPVSEANKDSRVIVNACESAPYRLRLNVKKRDKFWVKQQLYSIEFMLANDPLAEQFVGGTVYQGFLSNMTYHRWHAPVDGTIVRAYVVDGAYYAEARSMGWDGDGDNLSQAYLTEVNTRALIFIDCDNKDIGLMCFVGVGMGDVSSVEITVYEGQHVVKGQQTGMFHIGGSTHCLCFRQGVPLEFDFRGQTPSLDAKNIFLNEKIATVLPIFSGETAQVKQ